MNQVMQTLKRKDAERRIPVLRLEIDYELVTLHDAMQAGEEDAKAESKERLKHLHQEMCRLEASPFQ